jgi:hypothetical protein
MTGSYKIYIKESPGKLTSKYTQLYSQRPLITYHLTSVPTSSQKTAIMSANYQGQDPIDIAKQAEKDLHSHAAIHGHDAGISARHANGASTSSTLPLLPTNPT